MTGTRPGPYARAVTALPDQPPGDGGARARRTADSRALILEAAVACLVEDGYAGASTLAVQARAGVSRGRLLHHFPSRAELVARYCAAATSSSAREGKWCSSWRPARWP